MIKLKDFYTGTALPKPIMNVKVSNILVLALDKMVMLWTPLLAKKRLDKLKRKIIPKTLAGN
jgi:hypothetical protein